MNFSAAEVRSALAGHQSPAGGIGQSISGYTALALAGADAEQLQARVTENLN